MKQKNDVDFKKNNHRFNPFLFIVFGFELTLTSSIGSAQTWVVDSQYTNQPALATVQASGAYLQGITGAGVTIGLIDSGVNTNNSAITNALIGGISADGSIGVDKLKDEDLKFYHGTFDASLMVAARGNGGYFQGIAYDSKLIVGTLDFTSDAQGAKAFSYLTSQGVKVINNSWGSSQNLNFSPLDNFNAQVKQSPLTYQEIVNAAKSGAVLVFSAGNDSKENPNIEATSPIFNKSLQGSWLVVVATNINGEFASYSNQCGVTMMFCLAAPGGQSIQNAAGYDGGLVGINGAYNNNSITYLSGTSQAAPLVSGAVALVAQVFPWMTASQLTTTILTTASNAATPNTIDGRGMLNVSAAIKGPGIFETTFNANTAGYSSTFSNNISGTADLIKSGSGTLTLAGNNTYSGGTTVSGGTLLVLPGSSLGTGDVTINQGGILRDDGRTEGNINVASGGIFEPGNSPGYLYDPKKNVTMYAGSIYKQDIAGTIQSGESTPVGASAYYSYMNLGGQFIIHPGASLNPNLQNLFLTSEPGYGSAPYVPKLGDMFRIITAAGGILGTFSSIVQPAGMSAGSQFISFYNYAGSNSIDLGVIPTSYITSLSNSNANTLSVAAALDKLSAAQMANTATTTQSNLMYSTAMQTATSLGAYTQALAGEVYADTIAVIPQTSQRVQGAVMARLSDAVTREHPMGVPNASFSTNPAVNPAKDVLSPANNSVWGEIAYLHGNRSSDSNASGFNSNLYQAVFGADLYNENHTKAGAGFSLSTTNISMNSGTGTVGQGSLFVYGKMPVTQDYVLDVMASFGLSSTDVTRNDPSSTNSLKARGIKGNDVLLSAGISRPFETDEVTITPYVRATWQVVNQSPFDEGSASAAALSVNGYTGNGVRGLLGVSIGSKNKDPMVDPYTYKVNLAVGADTNTLINPSLTANLASYGTTIQAANVGNTFVQAGSYGTMKFADNAYAYAGITGEARSGQTLGGINVGLRVAF